MSSPDGGALVLVGPMGSGKTSVGKRVARALGWSFTDTDALVVRENGPLPQLFATHGEAHFRALERDAVSRALAGGGVVSLGGGAVLDARTRSDLAAHRVALLTVDPHVVASRLGGAGRPLLDGEDPLVRWERILAERRPLYEEVADATFDTSSGPLSRVVEAIVTWAQAPLPPSSPAQSGNQETL
ncbi:shikimate kinase [Microbacterium sp. NPDC078428]|uniref:shikimate kinase n=1 Tax=Microbacterium sp. NPDC078428 TaxID=3364190 RepID=UPI0037C86FA6